MPNAFVLKANHGSGYNRLVFDKRQVSYAELYDLSNAWMRSNFTSRVAKSIIWISNPASWWSACCWMASRCRTISSFIVSTTIMKFACSSGGLSAFRHSSARYFRYRLEPHRNPYQLAECRRTDAAPYAAGRNDAFGSPAAQQFSYVRVDFYRSARRCISVS